MPNEVQTVQTLTKITESGMFTKVFFDFSHNFLPIDNVFKSGLTETFYTSVCMCVGWSHNLWPP